MNTYKVLVHKETGDFGAIQHGQLFTSPVPFFFPKGTDMDVFLDIVSDDDKDYFLKNYQLKPVSLTFEVQNKQND